MEDLMTERKRILIVSDAESAAKVRACTQQFDTATHLVMHSPPFSLGNKDEETKAFERNLMQGSIVRGRYHEVILVGSKVTACLVAALTAARERGMNVVNGATPDSPLSKLIEERTSAA